MKCEKAQLHLFYLPITHAHTHTTPTGAHLYGACQEGHQVFCLADKDVDEVLRSCSLGRLPRGEGVLPPVAEAEGGDDL